MPRDVFNRDEVRLIEKGQFMLKTDATGKPGINPRIKLIAALRIFEYDGSFDALDKLFEISSASTRFAFV